MLPFRALPVRQQCRSSPTRAKTDVGRGITPSASNEEDLRAAMENVVRMVVEVCCRQGRDRVQGLSLSVWLLRGIMRNDGTLEEGIRGLMGRIFMWPGSQNTVWVVQGPAGGVWSGHGGLGLRGSSIGTTRREGSKSLR